MEALLIPWVLLLLVLLVVFLLNPEMVEGRC